MHKGTNTIETIRLILRRFILTDVQDMYRNWASDPETLKFLPWGPHEDIGVTERRIKSWVESYNRNNYYNWAICLKPEGKVIGSISVEIQNEREESCEVGYCIGREFWGRELVPEALRAVMHYLFYEVGFFSIVAKHDVLNQASGRVMQKAGMKFDRIINHTSRRRDGSFCDCAMYVRQRDEEE